MKINNIKKYIDLYYIENYLFNVIGTKAKKRGYLNFEEFFEICMWKSNRQKNNYLKNKNIVKKITKKAFEAEHEKEKINLLCKLHGVGIPTASAILTVVYPEKYAVIDIRCIEMLMHLKFNDIKKNISLNNWLEYLGIIRKIAKENNITPRQLDMALFAMHKEKLSSENYKNLYK